MIDVASEPSAPNQKARRHIIIPINRNTHTIMQPNTQTKKNSLSLFMKFFIGVSYSYFWNISFVK